MTRQFQHIELTRPDAIALRELVRPFDSNLPDYIKPALVELSVKIYAVLIELEKGEESVNIPLDKDECLLINQKVGNEDWDGALPLLRQTHAVLFEIKYEMPPSMGFDLEEFMKEIAQPDGKTTQSE